MNNTQPTEIQYNKIRGWLIFIAIILFFLLPISLYRDSCADLVALLWVFGDTIELPYLPFIILELSGNILFFIFSIIVFVYFFKRRRFFPKLILIFFISHSIFDWINVSIASLIKEVSIEESIILFIIYLGLSFYFLISKRVKYTFVT